jgi:hypothetical protein
MGRGTGAKGLGVLGAALGTALLFSATAIAKTSQAITLQEPSSPVVGASVSEPGESSVGLEVRLIAETPSVCTLSYFSKEVTGNKPMWTIKLIAGGTCTITASQAGNGEYEATEARLSFTVSGPLPGTAPSTVRPETRHGVEPGHEVVPSTRKREIARRMLGKALKGCKKDKSQRKREACEEKAKARYRKALGPLFRETLVPRAGRYARARDA